MSKFYCLKIISGYLNYYLHQILRNQTGENEFSAVEKKHAPISFWSYKMFIRIRFSFGGSMISKRLSKIYILTWLAIIIIYQNWGK